jgi:hypothetical protein
MSQHDDLIARLRNTPNWQRESFEHWKVATCVYDRAPFEAADAIAALVAERDALRHAATLALRALDDALGEQEQKP